MNLSGTDRRLLNELQHDATRKRSELDLRTAKGQVLDRFTTGGVLRQAYPKTSELKAIKLKATMVAVRDILTILAVISYSITLEAIVQF
jgi:hypothetical protein